MVVNDYMLMMPKKFFMTFLAFTLSNFVAYCTPSNDIPTLCQGNAVRNSSCFRVLPPESGIYFGAFPDLSDSEDQISKNKLNSFTTLAGKAPVWIYFSQNWWSGIRFPKKAVDVIINNGAIPFIRLINRSDPDAHGKPETKFGLAEIVSGVFDEDLRKWADEAKLVNSPLMLEFGPEVNDLWWSWNGQWNGGAAGVGLFKHAYRHIITLFREQGADNITWCYHVSAEGDPDPTIPENVWNTMSAYYPGDDLIDWIGLTIYGAHYPPPKEVCVTFKEQFDPAYNELRKISPSKPLAIFEFGTAEDSKPVSKTEWFTGFFNAIIAGEYPLIKAVAIWHSKFNEDGAVINMRIDSNPETLKTFQQGIGKPIFTNKVNILKKTSKNLNRF